MRSRAVLRQLAVRADVSLLVARLHGRADAEIPVEVAACCRQAASVPARQGTSPLLASIDAMRARAGDLANRRGGILPFAGDAFDVVHLYRLASLPYGLPYLSGERVAAHIDLDEAESASRRRMAALYRRTDRRKMAGFLDLEARLTERLEREVLARFDRVYVCSAAERDALPDTPGRSEVRVLVNTLDPPAEVTEAPSRDPFTLLFVATLGYPANEDAALFLCQEVLPHLRRLAPRAFEIVLAGGGATAAVGALTANPEVVLTGAVPSLTPWYERADVVVVPLRAGGGTRIKVLEAMRHGRPIVSTHEGVAGIGLRDGVHALLADAPDGFAAGCVRLMEDVELGRTLRGNALELFASTYTTNAMTEALDG
jgi:glycosyltransferase involved in cell wall biosynthesis